MPPLASAANSFYYPLVLSGAGEVGVVARDFLKAQHVEVGRFPGDPGDTRGIDPAVAPAAPLDVPGNELHIIPRSLIISSRH